MNLRHPNGVSIITGGGRGLGRAIALRLAREGPILVVSRTESELVDVCQEVALAGGEARYLIGDVTHPATALAAVSLVESEGWDLENMICNAGISIGGPTEMFSPEKWREVFDVNVHGVFHFAQAAVNRMLQQGRGNIVFMSSVAGIRGYRYEAAYTASKYALVGLARSFAQEFGKFGIVTVPVCPGFVDSEVTLRTVQGVMRQRKVSVNEAERIVAAANPQKRILPMMEVAEAVALVCSGTLKSLSGNPLILSGGE